MEMSSTQNKHSEGRVTNGLANLQTIETNVLPDDGDEEAAAAATDVPQATVLLTEIHGQNLVNTNVFRCGYCTHVIVGWESVGEHPCLKEGKNVAVVEDNIVTVYRQANDRWTHVRIASPNADVIGDLEGDGDGDSVAQSRSWSYQETVAFLNIIQENHPNIAHCRLSQIWPHVVKELDASGIQVTAAHCNNKWKNMVRTYRKLIFTKKEGPRFRYFDTMESLLQEKASNPHRQRSAGRRGRWSQYSVPETATIIAATTTTATTTATTAPAPAPTPAAEKEEVLVANDDDSGGHLTSDQGGGGTDDSDSPTSHSSDDSDSDLTMFLFNKKGKKADRWKKIYATLLKKELKSYLAKKVKRELEQHKLKCQRMADKKRYEERKLQLRAQKLEVQKKNLELLQELVKKSTTTSQ